jgi:hypothetical protein
MQFRKTYFFQIIPGKIPESQLWDSHLNMAWSKAQTMMNILYKKPRGELHRYSGTE